jgi:tetratricopeptide (TPR) repeat protein
MLLGGAGGVLAGALVRGGWLPGPVSAQVRALVALLPAPGAKSSSLVYESLFAEAREAVEPLVQRHPDRAPAVAALALLNFLAHDAEAERTCWKKCLELDPAFAAAYSRLGKVAMDRGEYAEAVRLMREALAVYPRHVEFPNLMASALLSSNQPQEAVRVLEAHARAVPNSPPTFFLLGQAYSQLNQFDRAQSCYETAIKLHPEYTNAYHGLATACTRLGRQDEAKRCREVFQRLKAKDQEQDVRSRDDAVDELVVPRLVADILTFAGQACLADGDVDDAAEHWRRAAALAPKGAACRSALVSLCLARGQLAESLSYARELVALEPDEVEHHRTAASLYAQLGQAEAAEKEYRAVCRLAPERGWGYAGLAQLYVSTKREPRETVALARSAVRYQPSAQNYVILAAACERADDPAGALAALEQAVAIAPDNVYCRQLLDSLRRKKK